jgi:RimJ/RimL family protein N-acetyltransferase
VQQRGQAGAALVPNLTRPEQRAAAICATILPPEHSSLTSEAIFSMSSYSVRPATPRDAKAIAEIHVATWQAAYKDVMPEDYISKMTVEKRQAYWREAIEFSEPQLLVATCDDQIVGFVGFDRSRDANTRSTVGEIWAIYVSPAHWGQGAGLALWDGARDGLKDEGCTQVTIWVLLRNERALQFCEHAAGFKREMPSLKTVAFGDTKLEEIRLKRSVS